MQSLFKYEEALTQSARASGGGSWLTRLLEFAGSAVICWIGLRFLAPVLAGVWGIIWLENSSAQIGSPFSSLFRLPRCWRASKAPSGASIT